MNNRLILFLKGVAMGAADTVPGVSGGTIAFIAGIYEELVSSLRSINPEALRLLIGFRLKAFWEHINGTFLSFLFLGILTAIAVLSRLILFLLMDYPVLLWAFFFGLIVASTLVVTRKIRKWDLKVVSGCFCGALLGYAITVASPAETTTALWFVFLSGMIAICAMILPGISGSFILVLLSKYEYILRAVKDVDLVIILTFGTGTVFGLLSFSHLLNWMLNRFYNITIAFLTGVMVGSLNKVWPWKSVLETYTTSTGKIKPLLEQNLLPTQYLEITHQEPYLLSALCLAVIGFGLVFGMDRLGPRLRKK
jgi:putative membrane protein